LLTDLQQWNTVSIFSKEEKKTIRNSLSKHYLSVVGGSILLYSENEEDALFSFTSERRRYLRERMKNSLKDSSEINLQVPPSFTG
jgi:hypothetical protein